MVDVTTGRLAIPIPEDSDPVALYPETFRDMAVELEDQFNFLGYSANWSGANADPSLGNGLSYAKYKYVAQDHIELWIAQKFGTTTTYGNGQWRFRLPVPAATYSDATTVLGCTAEGWAWDNSASALYRIYGRPLSTDASKLALYCDGTTAGGSVRNLNATTPFTFDTNDRIYLHMSAYNTDGTDPT